MLIKISENCCGREKYSSREVIVIGRGVVRNQEEFDKIHSYLKEKFGDKLVGVDGLTEPNAYGFMHYNYSYCTTRYFVLVNGLRHLAKLLQDNPGWFLEHDGEDLWFSSLE